MCSELAEREESVRERYFQFNLLLHCIICIITVFYVFVRLKVIMLVSEGKEQKMLKEILATKDNTNQRIDKSVDVNRVLYRHSPRIIPPEFNPQYVETFIKIAKDPAEAVASNTRGKKKATKEVAKVRN